MQFNSSHSCHPRLGRPIIGVLSPKAFLRDETGQDPVEYALVLALIAMGATASMSSLATSFSSAFSNAGSHLGTYTT